MRLSRYSLMIVIMLVTMMARTQIASAQLAADADATDFSIFAAGNVTLDTYSTSIGDVYAGQDLTANFGYGLQRPTQNSGDFYSRQNINTVGGLTTINGDIWGKPID